MSAAPPRQRLFFALLPDSATRVALGRLGAACLEGVGGRAVAESNLHLTVAFLGMLDSGGRTCAERAAASLSLPAFDLRLCRLGYWSRPRVLWSAPAHTPEPLSRLASALRAALEECGHEPETGAFRAHVTLARKLDGPVRGADHPSVHWPVADFHLMASENGAHGLRYRSLARWALA